MTDTRTPDAAQPAEKTRKPYRVFFWGALIAAALSFWLAKERLDIKRPAVADAYTITGILALLSAAMAWSQGSAHERSRRSQQGLQDSVDRLQDRMQDMPRSLMEESVKVAEREAEGRRADQERQATALRASLEDGIRAGFAPLAPALSERIEASLSGLSEALRQDRDERASGLREMSDTVKALRTAQEEWQASSAALLKSLREQGEQLHKDIAGRDTAGRQAWDRLSAEAAERFQAAGDIQAEKVRTLLETLSARWDETLRAQREAFATEWREVLERSREQLDAGSKALLEGVSSAGKAVEGVSSEAAAHLQASADQAGEWLGKLSAAAGEIGNALDAMRKGGEESAAQQVAWRETVEGFREGIGGVLDRLQSLGSFAQGQEALLHKMEQTIRAFEERSAELLEETALRAQESLLDALDQAGVAASPDSAGQDKA